MDFLGDSYTCMYTQHQWPVGNPVVSTSRTVLYKQVQLFMAVTERHHQQVTSILNMPFPGVGHLY